MSVCREKMAAMRIDLNHVQRAGAGFVTCFVVWDLCGFPNVILVELNVFFQTFKISVEYIFRARLPNPLSVTGQYL